MKPFLYVLGLIIIFISPFLGETQINIKDIFEFKYEDFELLNYDPHPHIPAPVAV